MVHLKNLFLRMQECEKEIYFMFHTFYQIFDIICDIYHCIGRNMIEGKTLFSFFRMKNILFRYCTLSIEY